MQLRDVSSGHYDTVILTAPEFERPAQAILRGLTDRDSHKRGLLENICKLTSPSEQHKLVGETSLGFVWSWS